MKEDELGKGYCFDEDKGKSYLSVIQDALKGSRVCVTWMDCQGYINQDLDEVMLAECKSEGVLVYMDNQMVVIRSAVYTDTETGDYTAIPVGCITEVKALGSDDDL